MVVGAFPAIKLSVLLFKQISKPIANYAKERAKSNRFFRTYICMPPAQFYNWCEIKSKMWILNLGKPVSVPPLSEQMAIELGANMLGEGIIFLIGGGLLIFEYNRNSKKEVAKETERVDEMNKLIDTVNELYFTSQTQQTKIREMERLIGDLDSKKFHKPHPILPDKEPPPPSSDPPLQPIEIPEELEKTVESSNKNNDYEEKKHLNLSLLSSAIVIDSRVVTKPWTLKQKLDSSEPPPPPGSIQAPLEPLKNPDILEETEKKPKPKKGKDNKDPAPFPEKNLVMKSLNYVELDVRSVPSTKPEVQVTGTFERKPSFVIEALSYLEKDVRGLLT